MATAGGWLTRYRPREVRNSIYRYRKIHIDYRSEFLYRFISPISIIYGNTIISTLSDLCQGIHQWPLHRGSVMRKVFPCHDILMFLFFIQNSALHQHLEDVGFEEMELEHHASRVENVGDGATTLDPPPKEVPLRPPPSPKVKLRQWWQQEGQRVVSRYINILGRNGVYFTWMAASYRGEARGLWINASSRERSLVKFHLSEFRIWKGFSPWGNRGSVACHLLWMKTSATYPQPQVAS